MHSSLTRAAACVAAAGLLVVGVDYAALATTGDSLILGQSNSAARRTTIVKQAPGAALSLQSEGDDQPSLRVSSDARVRRLNADMVDGHNASQLITRTVTYHAGQRRDVVAGGFGAWQLDVTPGIYEVSFNAVAVPDLGPAPQTTMICGIVDLNTIGPRTRVYTADSGFYQGDLPAAMSGSATIRLRASETPGIICVAGNNADFALFRPVTASITPIAVRHLRPAEPVTQPTRLGKLDLTGR